MASGDNQTQPEQASRIVVSSESAPPESSLPSTTSIPGPAVSPALSIFNQSITSNDGSKEFASGDSPLSGAVGSTPFPSVATASTGKEVAEVEPISRASFSSYSAGQIGDALPSSPTEDPVDDAFPSSSAVSSSFILAADGAIQTSFVSYPELETDEEELLRYSASFPSSLGFELIERRSKVRFIWRCLLFGGELWMCEVRRRNA